MAKGNAGRPSKMTADVLRKLEDGFLSGFSDSQACLNAGISESTLYDYQKIHPEFSQRKEALKSNVRMRAKINVRNAVESGDLDTSKWVLEKTDPEYKAKQQIEHSIGMNISHQANPKAVMEAMRTIVKGSSGNG